jgi:dUTP pyrophosphatase
MKKISVIYSGKGELPTYVTAASAGMDLRAAIEESISLAPMERKIVPTGVSIALPEGHEAQVRPRSGLAVKHGITVLNSPGTIDADYRGEIGVILINLSNQVFTVAPEDRIAQLVIAEYTQIVWEPTQILEESERGSRGFGSTGKK